MSDLDKKLRFNAVNEEAAELGYRIKVDMLPSRRTPLYVASAHALDSSQESSGRFLCTASTSLEAAEDGLEILRGIVKRGEPWPDQP